MLFSGGGRRWVQRWSGCRQPGPGGSGGARVVGPSGGARARAPPAGAVPVPAAAASSVLVLVLAPEGEVDPHERLLLLLADGLVGHDRAGQVGRAGGGSRIPAWT